MTIPSDQYAVIFSIEDAIELGVERRPTTAPDVPADALAARMAIFDQQSEADAYAELVGGAVVPTNDLIQ